MEAVIDHVVLWVDDPLRSVEFYRDVLGFPPVRLEEFRQGQAPFPSARLSPHTIVDFMAKPAAPFIDAMTGAEGSAGHSLNHVCFTVSHEDFVALQARLQTHGIATSTTLTGSFGARGTAPEAFYFTDPDGNVLEARYYAG